MSEGLKIRPQFDQDTLRVAVFGTGPWSEQLTLAIASIRIDQQELEGLVKASVLDTPSDDVVTATAHALAHRLVMGRDGAAHVNVSMSDALA